MFTFTPMLTFPNAKINLGLNILRKRPDGYHDIESCFYPIPWCDALEIVKAESFRFTSSGLPIPGDTDSNLCVKAYELLRTRYAIGKVHIHLHKVIPMGAGLGGGSADGAFTLNMLNELFSLDLSMKTLESLAAELGSDCPFFIRNEPAIATGRGTELQTIEYSLKGKFIALKNPGIHVGTQEAYAGVKPSIPALKIEEILKKPLADHQILLKNDFETSIFDRYPQISEIKSFLYVQGALYAAMTGSGSTVYGLFTKKPPLPDFEIFAL